MWDKDQKHPIIIKKVVKAHAAHHGAPFGGRQPRTARVDRVLCGTDGKLMCPIEPPALHRRH